MGLDKIRKALEIYEYCLDNNVSLEHLIHIVLEMQGINWNRPLKEIVKDMKFNTKRIAMKLIENIEPANLDKMLIKLKEIEVSF